MAGALDLLDGANFTLQKNLTLTGALTINGSTLNLGGLQASVGSLILPGAAVVNRGGGGGIQGRASRSRAEHLRGGRDGQLQLVGRRHGRGQLTNNMGINLAGAMGLQVDRSWNQLHGRCFR